MRKSIFLRPSKFAIRYSAVLLVVAMQSVAQEKEELVQSGTPALLEAANGKKAKVFLQRRDGENITFQPHKSPKDMTVPAAKIKSLQFFPKYDADAVEVLFISGDYAGALAVLDPLLEPYEPYMLIDNNLQSAFMLQLKARYEQADYSKVHQSADCLVANQFDYRLAMQGKTYKALAAIAEGDYEAAEKLQSEIESEAAKLYMQACTQRVQGHSKAAMQTVVDIIAEHGNDVEWLGPGELLSAHLYLDLALTNSAVNTARQVGSIYAGTHIAADAAKLCAQLEKRGEDKAE